MRVLGWLVRPFGLVLALVLWPWRRWRHARAAGRSGIVRLALDGRLRPLSPPPEPRLRRWLRRPDQPRIISVRELARVAALIADDPRVVAVEVHVRDLSGSLGLAQEVHAQLRGLRERGKRVIVHLSAGVENAAYLVAAAGDTILARPAAPIAPVGVAAEGVFVAGLLERLGVRVEVLSAGRYKSAPDALTRRERSPEDREQTEALVRGLDRALVDAIASGRGRTPEAAAALIDAAPAHGSRAIELGLVDRTVDDESLEETVRGLLERSGAQHPVDAHAYLARRRPRPLTTPRRVIAVVELSGAIVDRGSPYRGLMGQSAVEEQVVSDLRAALASPRVAGVILAIDSPGGSVLASDAIWSAVRRLDREKPVIAWMTEVAASGGYYAAAGARAIVASPLTITGSIGVFGTLFTWPTLAARLDLHADAIYQRKNARLYSPWAPLAPEARAHGEAEVQATYRRFLEIVAQARGRTVEAIDAVAQGRVWLGAEAAEAGLVDGLGGFDEALDRARRAAGGRLAPDPVRVRARHPLPPPEPALDPATKTALDALPAELRALVALTVLDRRPQLWAYALSGLESSRG